MSNPDRAHIREHNRKINEIQNSRHTTAVKNWKIWRLNKAFERGNKERFYRTTLGKIGIVGFITLGVMILLTYVPAYRSGIWPLVTWLPFWVLVLFFGIRRLPQWLRDRTDERAENSKKQELKEEDASEESDSPEPEAAEEDILEGEIVDDTPPPFAPPTDPPGSSGPQAERSSRPPRHEKERRGVMSRLRKVPAYAWVVLAALAVATLTTVAVALTRDPGFWRGLLVFLATAAAVTGIGIAVRRWSNRPINPEPTHIGRKTAIGSSIAALAIIALAGMFFLGKTLAPTGQVVTETASVSQEEITTLVDARMAEIANDPNGEIAKLRAENARLQAEIASAPKPAGPYQGVSSTAHLTAAQQYVFSGMQAAANEQGRSITLENLRFGNDIDCDLANEVEVGGSSFGDRLCKESDLVREAAKNTPGGAALRNYFGSAANSTDTLTAVQVMVPMHVGGNTQLMSNGSIGSAPDRIDPAGTVFIFDTSAAGIKGFKDGTAKVDLASMKAVRGACANPLFSVPVPAPPQGNGVYVPTKPAPPIKYVPPAPPQGNGCIENCNPVQPPPPPPCTENCHPVPPPPCKVDCSPTPPCEEECNPNPPCEENCTPNPPCEEECTPPPPTDDKCKHQGDKEFCGTPDTGGEQQPVQDNDPELVAPTPGYEEGSAEETLGNQDHCTTECGLDPTEDGTIVDGSENGGGAPGGHVEEPIVDDTTGSGGDNPNHDGTDHSANPDLGTAAPEDSTTSEETVDSSDSDWNSGFELPGINSGAQDNSSSIVEQDAPVTEMTTPSYTEQSTSEYTAPAVTQDYSYTDDSASAYSAPSTTDSSYDAPVAVDSSASSASSYSSDNTNVSSYTADTTVSTSNTTAADTSSTAVMEVD